MIIGRSTSPAATSCRASSRSVASAVIADIARAGSEDPIQSRFGHPLHSADVAKNEAAIAWIVEKPPNASAVPV
jgi:hypothetical protein